MEQVFNFIADPVSYGTLDTPSPLDPPFLRKKIPSHSSSGQDTAPADGLTPLESKIKNLILSAYSAEEPALPRSENKAAATTTTSSAPATPSCVERQQWSPSVPPSLPLHLIPAKTSDTNRLVQSSEVKENNSNSLHRSADNVMSSSSNQLTDSNSDAWRYPPVFQPSSPRPSSSRDVSTGEPNLPAALRYSSTPSSPAPKDYSSPVVYSASDRPAPLKYKPQVPASLMKHFTPPDMPEAVEYPLPAASSQSIDSRRVSESPTFSHHSMHGDITPIATSASSSRESSPPSVLKIPSHIQVPPKQPLKQSQPVPSSPRPLSSMTVHSTPPDTPMLTIDNTHISLASSSLTNLTNPSVYKLPVDKAMSETSSVKLPGKVVRTLSTGNTPLTTPFPGIPSDHSSSTCTTSVGNSPTMSVLDKEEVESLRRQLHHAREEKAHLEGQLESVVDQCRSTLKEKSDLHAKLARTETELKSYKERPEMSAKSSSSKKPIETTQDFTEVDRLESTLAQKRREMAVLNKEIDREKEKAKHLENDLTSFREQSHAKDDQIKDLQASNVSLRQEVDRKEDEAHELGCKVATLEASIKSTESAKSWLHCQLQDAVDSKVKVQEDLRACKATAIAQTIKMDQLQKENTLFRKQLDGLQNSILRDKAQLVSDLEAIEVDVARNEHSYAEMQDNKAQLEQLLALKTNELEHIGSQLAQLEAAKLASEDKASDSQQSNELLHSQLKKTERERDHLQSELQQARQLLQVREGEVAEHRKAKSALQDRLKQAETSLVGKQGQLQGLKDSRNITKHELEAVQQARASAEAELAIAAEKFSKLQDALEATEGRCLALQSQGQELEAALESNKLASGRLLSEVQAKTKDLGKRDRDMAHLQRQCDDLQTQFSSLQPKFYSAIQENAKAQETIEEKNVIIEQLQEQGDQAIAELEKEQESLVAKFQELQAENSRLQGHLESPMGPTLKEYQRALQDKAQLDGELSTAKVLHQHEMIKTEAKAHRLETELKDTKREARKSERKLQSQLETAQQQIEQLKEALNTAESKLKNVNSGLKEGSDEKQALQGDIEALKSNMAAKEDQVQQLSEAIEELERENESLREELMENLSHLRVVEQAHSLEAEQLRQAATKTEHQLKEKVQDLSLEKERYKGRLAGVGTTQACLKEQAEALEKILAQKESALAQLSLETSELVREKDKAIEELAENVTSTQDQLFSVKSELERALTSALLEKQRADELNNRLAEKERAISERGSAVAKRDLEATKEKVAELEGTNDDLQVELRTLKQQLAITQTTQESVNRELQEKDTQVALLQQSQKLAIEEIHQLQEELRHQLDHSRHIEELYHKVTDTNQSSFTGDISTDSPDALQQSPSAGEVASLKSELTTKSRALSSLQSCLTNMKQDMSKRQQHLDSHSVSLMASYHSSRDLESKIESLRHSSSNSPYPTSSTPTSNR